MDTSSISGSFNPMSMMGMQNMRPPEGMKPPGGMMPPGGGAEKINELIEGIESGEVTVSENDDGTLTINNGGEERTIDIAKMQERQEQMASMSTAYGGNGQFEDMQSAMDELLGTLVELTA